MSGPEGCQLEFKTAKNSFSSDKDLPDYCAALANEGGGKLILGVDDRRRVTGSKAFFGTHNTLPHELLNKLKIRVEVEELIHPQGRVLIFHAPPHPPGQPVQSTGKYRFPMRAGESLTEMDAHTLKRILNETEPDFSSQPVSNFSLKDIDSTAFNNLRKSWVRKAGRKDYLEFSPEKLLSSAGLLTEGGLTYAALILLGKKGKIDQLLPGSEIIFEWRQEHGKTNYDFRINWREPFFAVYDKIWEAVNARNLRFPYQDGLFQREIFAFSEKPIREALLNAVEHRDYHINHGSIFIKASPQEFRIESPGGFPFGVTQENILEKSSWRNRRIAETFEKAGLVERSGQGMDDIFDRTIRDGKGKPDLSPSDDFSVVLRIPAQVKDLNFVLFLERVANDKQISLTFEEICELETIRENQAAENPEYRKKFLELGIIEKIGGTSGAKYILSHNYYAQEGKTGVYTRLVGTSREQKKLLILNHLKKNKKGYAQDFRDVFPELKRKDITNLLQELKVAGKILHSGGQRTGYWVLTE